jgi:hypothetical protein
LSTSATQPSSRSASPNAIVSVGGNLVRDTGKTWQQMWGRRLERARQQHDACTDGSSKDASKSCESKSHV